MPGADEPVQQSYVLLHAHGFDLAVDAADLPEVFRSPMPLAALPRHDRRILGATVYQGQALPVTSICRWHHATDAGSEPAADRPLVGVLQHGARRLGLQLQQLARVTCPPASAVHRLCHGGGAEEIFHSTLRAEGRLWPILDVPALLQLSQAWFEPAAPQPDAKADAGEQPALEPMAVFRVGPTWFAVPAGRTLAACNRGHIQTVGAGQGPLAGAVPWRSHILPLLRLRSSAAGQAGPGADLMLVVRGTRQAGAAASDAAVAIEVDAVDRLHWLPQAAPSDAHTDAPDAAFKAFETHRARLADGRFVTALDPDALARHFALAWSSPGSWLFEPGPGGPPGAGGAQPDRHAEAYLVCRAGDCMAVLLSSVDAVLAPGAAPDSAAHAGEGTLVWRDQLLPVLAWPGRDQTATDAGCGAIVVMRSGGRRHALKVAAVEFIVPAGTAQLSAINWPGRGRQVLLTATVDGLRRSFSVCS